MSCHIFFIQREKNTYINDFIRIKKKILKLSSRCIFIVKPIWNTYPGLMRRMSHNTFGRHIFNFTIRYTWNMKIAKIHFCATYAAILWKNFFFKFCNFSGMLSIILIFIKINILWNLNLLWGTSVHDLRWEAMPSIYMYI